MFKLIDIIDKYRIKISIGLVLFYVIGTIKIISIPDINIQHVIYISAPTVFFSLIHHAAGIAIGLVSVLIVLFTNFEQQKVTLTFNTYVLYGVGIMLNTGMSYLVGTLKEAYLKNKKAFQEVEQSKAKYQKVVDNIKEGMVIVDSKGNVIFMNRSAAVMLSLSINTIGFRFFDAFNTSIPVEENTGANAGGFGSVTEYLLEYDHPERGLRQIAIAETPYLNRNGRLSGSLKFLQDVTETKEKEITIELLKKRNEYLLSELFDRIGNNLSAINSYINLYLRNDKDCNSKALDKVDDIINTMTIMNSEFFKNFEKQTVNLESCINRIIHDLTDKYYFSINQIKSDLIKKDVHIDIAVSFSMFFTILLAGIFIVNREEAVKPLITVKMGMAGNKTELQIIVEKKDFFGNRRGCETEEIEKDILSVLLSQFGGETSVVPGEEHIMKIVF